MLREKRKSLKKNFELFVFVCFSIINIVCSSGLLKREIQDSNSESKAEDVNYGEILKQGKPISLAKMIDFLDLGSLHFQDSENNVKGNFFTF